MFPYPNGHLSTRGVGNRALTKKLASLLPNLTENPANDALREQTIVEIERVFGKP